MVHTIELIINVLNSSMTHALVLGVCIRMIIDGFMYKDNDKIILYSAIGYIFLLSFLGLATVQLNNPFK